MIVLGLSMFKTILFKHISSWLGYLFTIVTAIIKLNYLFRGEPMQLKEQFIKTYKEHMGEVAVNLLIEKINGRKIAQKIIIPTKLILRKTTKEANLC